MIKRKFYSIFQFETTWYSTIDIISSFQESHSELPGCITTPTVRNTWRLLCSNGHLDRSRWRSLWLDTSLQCINYLVTNDKTTFLFFNPRSLTDVFHAVRVLGGGKGGGGGGGMQLILPDVQWQWRTYICVLLNAQKNLRHCYLVNDSEFSNSSSGRITMKSRRWNLCEVCVGLFGLVFFLVWESYT